MAEERAVYLIEGQAQLDGENLPPGRLLVLVPGEEPMLSADGPARVGPPALQPNLKRTATAWPVRSVYSTPCTTTAFMPKVMAPPRRGSLR